MMPASHAVAHAENRPCPCNRESRKGWLMTWIRVKARDLWYGARWFR